MSKRKGQNANQSPEELSEVEHAFCTDATGFENKLIHTRILEQISGTLWLPRNLTKADRSKRLHAAYLMLSEIKPADGLEGMLAVQMVATHNAAMECLRRAMLENQTALGVEMYLKQAQKLFSVFAIQLKALNKHRGKGHQKVTVEHVNIAAGGQAIVGNVEVGERREAGQDQPEASALTDNRGNVVDLSATESVRRAKVRR
jgi:hypothetical protein